MRSKEKWAAEYYDGVLRRSGLFQKAILALARKLAVILWRLWQENRVYRLEPVAKFHFTLKTGIAGGFFKRIFHLCTQHMLQNPFEKSTDTAAS